MRVGIIICSVAKISSDIFLRLSYTNDNMKRKKHNITSILQLTHATSVSQLDVAIKQYVEDNGISINDVIGYAAKIQGGAQTILSRAVFILIEALPSKLTYQKFLKSVGLTTNDISDQYYMDHVHAMVLLKLLDDTLSSQLRDKPVGILKHLAKLRKHPELPSILNEYLQQERSVRDTAKFVSCYIAKPIIKAKEEEHKLALPETPEDIEVKDNNGLYLELDADGKIPDGSQRQSLQHIVSYLKLIKTEFSINTPAYKQLQSIIAKLVDFTVKKDSNQTEDCSHKKVKPTQAQPTNQMDLGLSTEGGDNNE